MMVAPQIKAVHFLLVDDLEENLLSLEALLRREGLVLHKARSGQEALEIMLRFEIALAFLDVQMPEMDGFELAELMRGTERTRRVPIIFVTAGSSDAQRRFRGYEAGAVDFLAKPIEADIIRSKADVFFELYRQQQLLEQQRDELRASAQALKENDVRKDEFLATLAHELRNPLAPIRNGLQILRMSPSDTVAEDVRDMMDRQLSHLVRLIDDLLDVSRVSQGKIDLRKENIALMAVLEAALEGSRPVIEEGKHRLNLDVPDETIWVDGDLTRLSQVVSNLLNNAAKYTEPNGLITVKAQSDGEQVKITVTDTGIGIAPEMLPKVFELFTQVDHQVERTQGGLGIGLALVKRLVEMHGGSIQSSSEGLGKGSSFTVALPVLSRAEIERLQLNIHHSPPPMKPASEPVSSTLKVLVVDDNVASAKTTGWMLELIGYQPNLIHDGIEAVKAAKELRPDVIMLDIGLPGMSGYDVCRELRKDPAFKKTIFIAQTGWGQEKDRREAREAGFDHHLVKPVRLEDISALLSEMKPSTP